MSTPKKKKKALKPKTDAKIVENQKPQSVGAPSKYKEHYAQDFLDYFSIPPYETKSKQVMIKGVTAEIDVVEANDFPTLAGFAIKVGVHRDTLHEWATATNDEGELIHPEFADAYKRAKDFQDNFLTVNGLHGRTKEQFTQFLMINVLGYRNKAKDEAPDTIVNNNNFERLSDEEFNKLYEAEVKKIQGK